MSDTSTKRISEDAGRERACGHADPMRARAAALRRSQERQASKAVAFLAVLVEANLVGVLLEATAADVESVLANNADSRRANTALARALAVSLRMRAPNIGMSHVGLVSSTLAGGALVIVFLCFVGKRLQKVQAVKRFLMIVCVSPATYRVMSNTCLSLQYGICIYQDCIMQVIVSCESLYHRSNVDPVKMSLL